MSTESAWAAGFFDGEGSSGFYGNAGGYRVCASVTQKDLRPLRRFQAAVGFGWIGKPQKNGCSHWTVTSIPDVRRLHELLRPFLSEPKREQFARTLAALDGRRIVQPHVKQGARCADCDRPPRAKGRCHTHYMTEYRKGRVLPSVST